MRSGSRSLNRARDFGLSFVREKGEEPNPAPLRPIYKPTEAQTMKSMGLHAFEVADDDAYVDVVLPFGREFHGNDVLTVDITRVQPTVTESMKTVGTKDDGHKIVTELKEVALVDKAEYPGFRPLYYFNLAAGVVLSGLPRPDYKKRKTVLDDPETEKVDEARYVIEDSGANRQVVPLLAFTWYGPWGGPIDIQEDPRLDPVSDLRPVAAAPHQRDFLRPQL